MRPSAVDSDAPWSHGKTTAKTKKQKSSFQECELGGGEKKMKLVFTRGIKEEGEKGNQKN